MPLVNAARHLSMLLTTRVCMRCCRPDPESRCLALPRNTVPRSHSSQAPLTMVLVLIIGDLHIPMRCHDLPAKFKKLLVRIVSQVCAQGNV
jgi:hypothetical protein